MQMRIIANMWDFLPWDLISWKRNARVFGQPIILLYSSQFLQSILFTSQ